MLDDNIISAWTGHPYFRIIDNSTDFEHKIQRLVSELKAFLGEQDSAKIEKKFAIEYPDISLLESLPYCKKVEIIQTYVKLKNSGGVRIRKRGYNGNYIYTQTTKRKINDFKRIVLEKRLTKREYERLLAVAGPNKKPTVKDRYYLTYENQSFEIDIFPSSPENVTCKIKLNDENAEIKFPPYIKVIKEISEREIHKSSDN